MVSSKFTLLLILLFISGAALRAVYVWRPVDRPSWRECDIAAVSRNYYSEGMNLFYPRIDWRGDGPGYAEMEFPLYPWSIAVLYKMFGIHEVFGRLISYAFALVTMFFFFKTARYLLAEPGALIAAAFFAFNPLIVGISTSLQPEGLMFLCIMVAVYGFIRWLDDASTKYFCLALLATALAILAKATAAHIGLLFAALTLAKFRARALVDWRVWVFAIGSLLPAILWYAHARRLWTTYGISLGLSNETHWLGRDYLSNPTFILGITKSELLYVWMFAGVFVALAGLLFAWKERAVRISLLWFASTVIFYLVAARTAADDWAYYYHVISTPPAAILIGAGVNAALRLDWSRRFVRWIAIASLSVAVIAGIAGAVIFEQQHIRWPAEIALIVALSAVALFALAKYSQAFKAASDAESTSSSGLRISMPALRSLAVCVVVLCVVATLVLEVRQVRADFVARDEPALRECARAFLPSIPPGVLIVASGGPCNDETGYPVAFNSSYMFYWMDRKGFNICVEKQSVAALDALASRGARYFIAEKESLRLKPGFEAALRGRYQILGECDAAYLFRLLPETGQLEPGSTAR